MQKTLIAGAVITSLAAGTAAAQMQMKNEPAKDTMTKPPVNATTPDVVGNTNEGFVMTKGSAKPVTFSQTAAGAFMTSELIGTEVYNSKEEHVGEIVDIAIDKGKTITGVVLSVGGFLGIGERHVIVEPQSVAVVRDGDDWKAYVETTKDSLKNAPEFKYETASKS